MKTTKTLLSAICMCCAFAAAAQSRMFSMNYSMAFPSGDLHDFIDKASFRGVSVDWRSSLSANRNIAVGFDFGWNVFYKRESQRTYTNENTSITGIQYRYTNSFPMLAAIDYIWEMDKLKPFAGLGIGTIFNVRDNDMGLYRFEDKTWHFALKPEIGLMYRVSPEMGIKVAGKYCQAFNASDLDGQSFFAVDVGLVFMSLE